MIRFSKTTLSLGGAAIVAAVLIPLAPKTAHALVAALVQVANTAATPAVTQAVGEQAAQIVEIECGTVAGLDVGCTAVPATGLVIAPPLGSRYNVPADATLVVTSVDILSGAGAGFPCMSPAFGQLSVSGAVADLRKSWTVPSGAGMAHYVYPSGILFPPGIAITQFINGISACTMTLDMHGYLTAQ